MKFEESDHVPAGSVLTADICVIGSGAAGVALACELNGSRRSVILLEAGGLQQNQLREDELFAIEHLGLPHTNKIPTRGRWYGGSTNLWFGRIALPDPIDLTARSWVPWSGWPLSYEQLAPWLARAGALLEVPHFDKLQIENWPTNPTIQTFQQEGTSSLGVFLWADGALMGATHRKTLEASKNVRLLLDSTATELVPNEASTHIDSLETCGRFGNRFTIQASTYVLAAGALENTRLLLRSTRRSAAGIANERDLVGRFYMDHPRGDGLGRVDLTDLSKEQRERLTLLGEKRKSRFGKVQMRLTFSPDMQRKEGLLNHSLHAHLTSPMHDLAAFQSAKRLLARLKRGPSDEGSPRKDLLAVGTGAPELLGAGLRSVIARNEPSTLITVDQMEQVPDPESRVTLDWERRNRWGIPALQLNWKIGEATYRSQQRMHGLFKSILEKHGIFSLRSQLLEKPDELPPLQDMKHHSGTTRMSSSAADGVVDADLRAHNIKNLYVTGSSTFPTVGHFNPTLLIVALAARLASRLRD
ncbi:MAG: GMC family oxidoreductase [Polyangiaceae bacterium]